MSGWPGWDSLESAGGWEQTWFRVGLFAFLAGILAEVHAYRSGRRRSFAAGIAPFCVMAVALVATHLYGHRSNDLLLARESDEQARHEREARDLNAKLVNGTKRAGQRVLSPEQREAIVAAVSEGKGQKVTFMSSAGDTDGASYKRDLAAALRAAGWAVDEPSLEAQSIFKVPPIGVQVALTKSEPQTSDAFVHAQALAQAFARTGVISEPGIALGADVALGTVVIVVGSKAPVVSP